MLNAHQESKHSYDNPVNELRKQSLAWFECPNALACMHKLQRVNLARSPIP